MKETIFSLCHSITRPPAATLLKRGWSQDEAVQVCSVLRAQVWLAEAQGVLDLHQEHLQAILSQKLLAGSCSHPGWSVGMARGCPSLSSSTGAA